MISRGLLLRALPRRRHQTPPPHGPLWRTVCLRLGGRQHRAEGREPRAGGGHRGGHPVGGILHLHQERGLGRGREPDAGLQKPPEWERWLLPAGAASMSSFFSLLSICLCFFGGWLFLERRQAGQPRDSLPSNEMPCNNSATHRRAFDDGRFSSKKKNLLFRRWSSASFCCLFFFRPSGQARKWAKYVDNQRSVATVNHSARQSFRLVWYHDHYTVWLQTEG